MVRISTEFYFCLIKNLYMLARDVSIIYTYMWEEGAVSFVIFLYLYLPPLCINGKAIPVYLKLTHKENTHTQWLPCLYLASVCVWVNGAGFSAHAWMFSCLVAVAERDPGVSPNRIIPCAETVDCSKTRKVIALGL